MKHKAPLRLDLDAAIASAMEQATRKVARELASEGVIEITQKGKV